MLRLQNSLQPVPYAHQTLTPQPLPQPWAATLLPLIFHLCLCEFCGSRFCSLHLNFCLHSFVADLLPHLLLDPSTFSVPVTPAGPLLLSVSTFLGIFILSPVSPCDPNPMLTLSWCLPQLSSWLCSCLLLMPLCVCYLPRWRVWTPLWVTHLLTSCTHESASLENFISQIISLLLPLAQASSNFLLDPGPLPQPAPQPPCLLYISPWQAVLGPAGSL